MAYSQENLLVLCYQGDGIYVLVQTGISLLGIDNNYTLQMWQGSAQSGANPKNLDNFQCEPSFNHNINISSINYPLETKEMR